MFRRIEDFTKTWRRESAATAKVLERLSDDSLSRRLDPDQRSIGEVAWHVVVSASEILGKAGIDCPGPSKRDPHPGQASHIHAAYVDVASRVPGIIEAAWEDQLDVELDFYGSRSARGEVLAILLRHEIHHRGQLTAQMRPAGLKVPGVYGPSADD